MRKSNRNIPIVFMKMKVTSHLILCNPGAAKNQTWLEFSRPETLEWVEFSRPEILEWVAFPLLQRIVPTQGSNPSPVLLVDSLPAEPQFSSVQSLSRVRLFATPWIAARQASLSITNSQSSLRLRSIESVMPSSHLILCHPLFLLPLIPPSISRVFFFMSLITKLFMLIILLIKLLSYLKFLGPNSVVCFVPNSNS